MKKHIKKAMKDVAEQKQSTFFVEEPKVPRNQPYKQEKRKKIISPPSFWICINGHIFEQKREVHQDRIGDIKCPICSKPIKHKTSKSTYQYYLKKQGRIDEKAYRAEKLRKDKQRERKNEIMKKTVRSENVEQY